ncbi:Leukocyte receptor cluster member 8 [Balamuthia mandrillaris]
MNVGSNAGMNGGNAATSSAATTTATTTGVAAGYPYYPAYDWSATGWNAYGAWGSPVSPDAAAAYSQYYAQWAPQTAAAWTTTTTPATTHTTPATTAHTQPAVATYQTAASYQQPPSTTTSSVSSTTELYDPSCPTDTSASPSAPEYLSASKVSFQMRPSKPTHAHTYTPQSSATTTTQQPQQQQQQTTTSSSSTQGWPPSLRNYVERAFAQCQGDEQRNKMEVRLKTMITECIANSTLWHRDWNTEPLPDIGEATSYSMAGKGKKRPLQADTSTPGKNKSSISMLGIGNAEEDKREKRSQRFKRSSNQFKRKSGLFLPPPMAESELDWDSLVIRGTSTELEKQYLRLTSAPDPATVRPQHVLTQSLQLIKNKWKHEEDYHYACEQLKSIRQDLTVQHIKNSFAIEVYETHARLALENSDLGEFNQCLTQLLILYTEVGTGSAIEFTAYRILYCLYSNNAAEITQIMAQLDPGLRNHEFVSHALKVREAMALSNYYSFFRLYQSVPNMGVYIMDLFVDEMRLSALRIICKAYRPSMPVKIVKKELAFSSMKQCVKFLRTRKAVITRNSDGELEMDTKASYPSFVSGSSST